MRWPAAMCMLVLLLLLAGAANAAGEGHFTITYTTGRAHAMDDACLLDALENAYTHVNGRFGTCPGRIEVIIVDDKAMNVEAGEQVDAFSAWNKLMSAVVLRQSTLKNRTPLQVTLKHEMSHLAINEILSKKDPREFRWMEEGISTLVSGEPLCDADISKYIVSHGFLDTGGIIGAIKNEDCAISKNGYMQSYSLVKLMEQKYGMSAVIRMLECPEASLSRAFRQCTGRDFPAFYGEWKKEVMAMASG